MEAGFEEREGVIVMWREMEGSYHFDSTIPGARAKGVLRYQVPVYSEDFSIMLFPALNRELVKPNVEELDGAITGRYQALVLVGLGPGEIEEGVLRVEP